jgi:repressor of nif and glnA expression
MLYLTEDEMGYKDRVRQVRDTLANMAVKTFTDSNAKVGQEATDLERLSIQYAMLVEDLDEALEDM